MEEKCDRVKQRTGEMIGLNMEQRFKQYFLHKHKGDENKCCGTISMMMTTTVAITAASIIDIMSSSCQLVLRCNIGSALIRA